MAAGATPIDGRDPSRVDPAGRASGFAKGRIGGFDLLKVFAAYSIVLFHSSPDTMRTLGAIALLLFLTMFFVLQSQRNPTWTFLEMLTRCSRQLLVPWLIWSAVYLAANLYLHRDKLSSFRLPPNWLVVGTTSHMWFLVFAFLGSVILWPVRNAVDRFSPRTVFAWSTVALALGVATLPTLINSYNWGMPFQLWVFAMPSLLLGLAISSVLRAESEERARSYLLGLAVAISVGCAVAWHGIADVAISYGLTTWLVIGALVRPVSATPWLRGATTATLGIYLIHPLVNLTFIKFLGGNDPPLLRAQAVFVLSFAAIFVLRRTPALHKLLGERV